jgi:uncharacterized membrane protein
MPNDAFTASRPNHRDVLWPAAVSLLCMAHCLLLPVLVIIAPAMVPHPQVKLAITFAAVAVAVAVLARGIRAHRRRVVWFPALVGIALWAAGHTVAGEGTGELLLELVGAVLIATGLMWSGRLRHGATCGAVGAADPDRLVRWRPFGAPTGGGIR